MTKSLILALLAFLSLTKIILSQEILDDDYSRSTISTIYLENDGSISNDINQVMQGIKRSNKYFYNNIDVKTIRGLRNLRGEDIKKQLEQLIKTNKVPNKIILDWVYLNNKFTTDRIEKRGLYNAKQSDFIEASADKKGNAVIRDKGEKLINKNYIFVFDYKDVRKVNTKTSKGWEGGLKVYVYKLNFNEETAGNFWKVLWGDKEKVMNYDFPLEFVNTINISKKYRTSNKKSKYKRSSQELFAELISDLYNEAFFKQTQENSSFQVKTKVWSTSPISAKVGRKEDIKPDNRYFIYENTYKGVKRKAVVRATANIGNNVGLANENNATTEFYQIAGWGIDQGMTMVEKLDNKIALIGGKSIGEVGGIFLKAEMFISKVIPVVDSWKIYAEAGIESTDKYNGKTDFLGDDIKNTSFTRVELGFSKSYHFAKLFEFAPSIAYGMEFATNSKWNGSGTYLSDYLEDNKSIRSDFIVPGVAVCMNLRYNIQLYGSYKYYAFIGNIKNGGSSNSDDESESNQEESIGELGNYKWGDVFKDRKGLTLNLGVRIQF